MQIHIEHANKNEIRSFPNKNIQGARWFVSTQDALLFKAGSKYPDKFLITLAFADNEQDALSIRPFAVGAYNLSDSAYSVDRRGEGTCDFTKLEAVKN